ncbi:hypothetical protein B0H19DRAFT_1078765 [Mycena capillaripes]|nr:hypothetical protein B0H19DRAFT_1078765 [Mycena capillaripes]
MVLRLAHLFEKPRLIKKWNEDFPAIHREGGHPADKNAGVVAFFRDRMMAVHTEDNPRSTAHKSQDAMGFTTRQIFRVDVEFSALELNPVPTNMDSEGEGEKNRS